MILLLKSYPRNNENPSLSFSLMPKKRAKATPEERAKTPG